MFLKRLILAAGLAVALASPAVAQVIGGEVDMDVDRDGDLTIFAGEVDVRGRIGGELRAIGGDMNVDAQIGGDANLAGGDISVRGSVGGDLSVAGGELDIETVVSGTADLAGGVIHVNAPVSGRLSAAGGFIELDRNFSGGDGVDLVAEQIVIRGTVAGDADLSGDEITIEGTIDGDVETFADYVRIAPGASITGELRHRGPNEPDVGTGATIGGGVDYTNAVYIDELDFDGIDLDLDFAPPGPVVGAFFVGFYFLFFLLASALMPNGVTRMVGEFRSRPVVAPLIGFVTWAFWPVILAVGVILLAITIVGVLLIPFWVLMIFFVLSLSYPFGAAAIGDLVFNRKGAGLGLGMRLLTTLGVLVLAAALWVQPILGVIGWCVLTWIGLGAWLFALGKREPVVTQPAA
ncbi:hypothetical protein L5876_04545 [Hyphobacterium sp. SN044]|uniref:hypothetical protein n=1 Tax=Hyphobacterium sp. SN044 TaxID=2912575 RepID=UPI001F206834|nr:hypothetical protein [Hyphobacterium sp. SN044]MCF8879079.1 hypothetical protein [Hyphobacterium sp. SN044]